MPEPASLVGIPAGTLWAIVGTLCAYSVYLGFKHMLPVWAERYKVKTVQLKERDLQSVDKVFDAVNGKLDALIDKAVIAHMGEQATIETVSAALGGCVPFQQVVDGRFEYKIKNFLDNQSTLIRMYSELRFAFEAHRKEDTEAHERVAALESEVGAVKDSVERVELRLDQRCDKLERIQREGEERTHKRIDDATTATSLKLIDIQRALDKALAKQ